MEVTMEQFISDFYNIYPRGSAEVAYELITEIEETATFYDKTPITFEALCLRYTEYVAALKPYNDVPDDQKRYIKKENKIEQPSGYLYSKMYLNDYAATISDPNDAYLFGI